MAWPEFVGLVKRAGQYSARELLTYMDATTAAIGQAFGGGSGSERRTVRKQILDMAYPPDPEAAQATINHLKHLEAEQHGTP